MENASFECQTHKHRSLPGTLKMELGAHSHCHPPRRLCDRWQSFGHRRPGEDHQLEPREPGSIKTLRGTFFFLLAQPSEGAVERL